MLTPHDSPDRLTRRLYAAYWVLLGALVVAFVVHLGAMVMSLIAAMMLSLTVVLYTRSPLYALCTLPGPLMLGIVVRVPLGGANVNFGDVHLFVVALMFVMTVKSDGRIFVGKPGFGVLVAVLVILSWLFSADLTAATITMFGFAELLLIYCLTLNIVKGEQDGMAIVWAWCGTITLCSALVVVSYLRNEPLILGGSQEFADQFGQLKTTGAYFLRASFFITSFNYPLTLTLVMLAVSLLLGQTSALNRAVVFGALLINIGATVLLFNKSVMFAAGMTWFAAVLFLARYKRVWARLSVTIVASAIVANIALLFIERIITPQQLLLFLVRAGGNESFIERLTTWKGVIAAVLASPHVLLIGLGPDVSTRGPEELLIPIIGDQRGIDSQYFFILLNYGIFMLAIYLGYFVRSSRLLLRRATNLHQVTPILILACMLAWLLVGIGQQGGVAKTMAVGIQFAAIIELVRSNRYAVGTART